MAHTLKAALTEAASRYSQHAAYLHALIHAPAPGDSDPADTVEWAHGARCYNNTTKESIEPSH